MLAALLDGGHGPALALGEFGVVPEDLGVSQDGVHRRADFVAHVGQEDALGAVGSLGLFLGPAQLFFGLPALGDLGLQGVVGLRQLEGALLHPFFQHFLRFPQFGVALLDLAQHFVEAIAQFAYLVAAFLGHPAGVVAGAGYALRRFGQVEDGVGDLLLEEDGQQHGNQQAETQQDEGFVHELFHPLAQLDHVGVQVHRAHAGLVVDDLLEKDERFFGELVRFCRCRGKGEFARTLAGIGGENFSVLVVDAAVEDVGLHRQRAQDLRGGIGVEEEERRNAVLADNQGRGTQALDRSFARGADILGDKDDAGHDQHGAGGENLDGDQLLFYRNGVDGFHISLASANTNSSSNCIYSR